MTEEKINENIVDLNTIENHYSYLKVLVESMEADVLKSNKGNKAAGVRLRKSLRSMKDFAGSFVKFTLNKD